MSEPQGWLPFFFTANDRPETMNLQARGAGNGFLQQIEEGYAR
ncbi:MAG: hypothetical protein VYC17_02660 [Nitrospinota bacterium]|nr:hypothetical protein [Nitrospinota bacterium]